MTNEEIMTALAAAAYAGVYIDYGKHRHPVLLGPGKHRWSAQLENLPTDQREILVAKLTRWNEL